MSGLAVVVSPNPDSDAGGTERFCGHLAGLLRKLDFEVSVIGPAPAPRWLTEHGGSALWQARTLRRATNGTQPDLVITNNHLGWAGPWRGRRVHVLLGNMARQALSQGGNWHWRLRWGFDRGLAEAVAARGALLVAASEQVAEDARRLYRVRVDAVVPLAVDPDGFHPRDRTGARHRLGLRPDGRYGLFVGRGERGKGPDIALEGCRRAGYQLLAAGARPTPGTIPLGVLSTEDLAQAYAAADAVVLPTRYEGFGLAAAEALACGVPTVTTPTGWARELSRAVPEYRPWLVAPEPGAVAGALGRIDSPEARAATAAARDHVLEHYSRAAFERRWTDLLASIDARGVTA